MQELAIQKSKEQSIFQLLKVAFPHTIPVLVAFLFLGATYGILMDSKGYGVFWSVLMSAIAFCGSMQFVAITLLTVSFAPVQAFFLALMVNARHLFYGISMLETYRGVGKSKPLLIYTLCDETFSINYSAKVPDGVDRGKFYLCISLMNYGYWVIGTFIGGMLGQMISFNTTGLDFALTTLFIVIFIEQWKEKKNRLPGLIGVGCSVICLLVFGAEDFIIPAMAMIVALLTVGKTKLEGDESNGIH